MRARLKAEGHSGTLRFRHTPALPPRAGASSHSRSTNAASLRALWSRLRVSLRASSCQAMESRPYRQRCPDPSYGLSFFGSSMSGQSRVATQALFFFLEEGRKRSITLGNGFHVATFTYFDACNEHA